MNKENEFTGRPPRQSSKGRLTESGILLLESGETIQGPVFELARRGQEFLDINDYDGFEEVFEDKDSRDYSLKVQTLIENDFESYVLLLDTELMFEGHLKRIGDIFDDLAEAYADAIRDEEES